MTEVRRIDLTTVKNLAEAITSLCNNMLAGGYALASTFEMDRQLILIFQQPFSLPQG